VIGRKELIRIMKKEKNDDGSNERVVLEFYKKGGLIMKNILRKVPGFRSDKLWKKIVASIFYFMVIVAIVTPGSVDSEESSNEEAEAKQEVGEEESEEKERIKEEESQAKLEEEKEKEESEKEVEARAELKGADLLEVLVIESIGEETNMGNERIIEIIMWEDEDEIILNLHGSENLTANMTKNSLLNDSRKLSQVIYEDGSFPDKTITINWHMDLVDGYGNDVVRNVLLLGLTPEDAERINWDAITSEQFENITLHWKHPNIFD